MQKNISCYIKSMFNIIQKAFTCIKLFLFKTEKKLILCFLSTFILGLIGHAFCYFNVNFSHDSLFINQLYDSNWQISLGRFFQPFYCFFRGNIYNPFLVGIFSLFFLSISSFLVCKVFDINRPLYVVFLCGLLSLNSTIVLSNATYLYLSDLYCLSLLFSVLGVLIIKHYQRSFVCLTSSIFFMLSLSIYQSYIQVSTFCILILLIEKIYLNESNKNILYFCIKTALSLLIGALLYFLCFKFVCFVTHIAPAENYNSLSQIFKLFKNGEFFKYFGGIYTNYFEKIFNPLTHNSSVMRVFNILFILYIFISLIILSFKKNIYKLLLVVSLFVLYPVFINFTYLLSRGSTHELTNYSFFFVYVWGILLTQDLFCYCFKDDSAICKISIPICKCFLAFFCTCFLVNDIVFSNQVYFKKSIEFTNTLNTMNLVINRIEKEDGYNANITPVVFVGDINKGPIAYKNAYFYYSGVGLWEPFSVTYYSTYISFIKEVMQHPMNILPESKALEFKNLEEVKNMELYPSNKSCKFVGGTIVVKFSN